MKNFALALILVFVFSNLSVAATVTPTPKDSTVMFRVNHDLGYTVGYFNDFTATIEVGESPAQVISAKFQVDTASVQTRNAVRDEGLKSALFLDTSKFPQATFEGSQVQGDEITGTLTIKGVSKPVTFKIERPEGKMLLKTTINRIDFDITYNKVLADKKKSIGESVDLIIELTI